MVVPEPGAISNIMGGMENSAGVRLHSHRHKLKQRFDIIRKLGQGTYGKVQLAINKDTGQEVAIKTIKKARIETEQDLIRIRREIQIMSSVQHPQIIHIYEVFENREKMVLVMEYAAGGELYDYLSERKVLSVDEARRVFRQVASAVYYCHKNKICHRDLKLENILLDIDGNAKIADFGLSNVFDEKRRLDTFCGSPLYASPEIVKGVPYIGPEVDCWSLGVLLYTLVYGAMPFDGSNFRRLVKQITQGEFYEPPTPSSASQLVRGMLTVSAEKRATIADICSHWWVNEGQERNCLDEAEKLANQTPVRLDLLLSLAPKHIDSEHMLIQPPDELDEKSEIGQATDPHLQLPPPPPVPPPPNGPQTRSLSLGAVAAPGSSPLMERGAPSRRRDDDKRRRESEVRTAEIKKRKEAPPSHTPSSSEKPLVEKNEEEEDRRHIEEAENRQTEEVKSGHYKEEEECRLNQNRNEEIDQIKYQNEKDEEIEQMARHKDDEELRRSSVKEREKKEVEGGEAVEREKSENNESSKKGDVVMEGSPMDISEDQSFSQRDSSVECEVIDENKVVKRKTIKKKGSTSSIKDTEKKLGSKSKEPVSSARSSVTRMDIASESPSRESTPKALTLAPDIPTKKMAHRINNIANSTEPKSSSVRSPSNKSVTSAVSNDGTLRASDSSISTRHSVSPPKPVVEPDQVVNHVESKPVTKTSSGIRIPKDSKGARVSKTNSAAKVASSISVPKIINNLSAVEIDTPISNGSSQYVAAKDTAQILNETADKIEKVTTQQKTTENDNVSKRKISDGPQATDSTSSKDSSQHSSVVSTPARSRTGSESSGEARPGRQDSSRRSSKVFSKAAMWDNFYMQQQSDKPPPVSDKPRKTPRPGGLNMSDITKKFEEKPPADRRKSVVGSFKISDVKKSFENKSSERVGGLRRPSTEGSGDSLPTSPSRGIKRDDSLTTSPARKKDQALPISPSRITKKEDSLPPPSKLVKKPEPTSTKEKDEIILKQSINKLEIKTKTAKEKSPVKSKAINRSSVSPSKETPKKAKSPMKEATPKREITVKRDVTTSKRASPIKDKLKPVSIDIKKPAAVQMPPKRDVRTPDSVKVKRVEKVAVRVPSPKFDSSDSSDSESEAERLLRQLSERRGRIEAAKKEKLRKVSLQQNAVTAPPCARADKTRVVPKQDSGEKPGVELPPDSPEEAVAPIKPAVIPKASMTKDAEQPPKGSKFATLPRGFKAKAEEKTNVLFLQDPPSRPLLKEVTPIPPTHVVASTPAPSSPRASAYDEHARKKSEVEIVLNSSGHAKQLQQQQQQQHDQGKRASYAEIQLAPPPQEFKTEVRHSIASAPRLPPPRRDSPIGLGGDGALQRAPRERIIPIMLEDQDDIDDDQSVASDDRSERSRADSFSRGQLYKASARPGIHIPPHMGGIFPGGGLSSSRGSVSSAASSPRDQQRVASVVASSEHIRKSRRERIIPIAMEGDGPLSPNTLDLNTHPSYSQQSRSESSSHGLGRCLPIERAESLSSDGDEDEEEEDEDGFQIMTAETLFSTLLNRVRNLTKKMSHEELRSRRLQNLPHHQPLGFHHAGSPFSALQRGGLQREGIQHGGPHGAMMPPSSQSQDGGFWSSLYSPPRELSRQGSETSTNGRGGERGGSDTGGGGRGMGTSWGGMTRSMSRDPPDSPHRVLSEPTTPYNTLPRATREAGVPPTDHFGDHDQAYQQQQQQQQQQPQDQQEQDRVYPHRRPLMMHDRFFSDT